ncbi:cysteine--1-D-myo-inosityl 2-amino-2-deoxy-alpha-D-glucopyranoside ligase [Pseudarthrobacter sp. J75]|uniref:cysteine--1-D-myo-inosityl 2-amino-2-deoxy-alpha-D-glucopyranoside ligase n=1 Tax=unclassified Pseudarthrobacter TaxID=2647000 RepID=UPI002E80CB0F|nr:MULTISPECIES: cysteine--1-D-myo-inosityl 2-amino-2-deoxy-alpha-D-glucopyranoside ligase [unclassified Pseudarthrobacter]MEE2523104.1 cysteine--1-D-myo-inosityl 2-amino-2-deoxy-alpha-D-glucopyranoside ligase [Pseudarthrobacter sp. J47]MEE2529787.1 cysteine--1-D-myo-inosityl 2-amino-2-deoxy-alpha-D-glucopyranoside ligase [Pseudarthrobacter sp. J75]
MKTWTSLPVPEVPGRMPAIRIFDSALRREVTLPAEGGQSLYVCGITPYDATHMGHAATYVAFDLLNRAWRDAGLGVSYVQNVTDVDDPLLERATATGVDWQDLAAEQIALFHADMEALNVLAPDHYVGAVEAVPDIVPEIERLIEAGLAYRVAAAGDEPAGDVYYDVVAASNHPDLPGAWKLGSISNLPESDMLELFAERGGDPQRPGKKNALDPLLWRVARPGEPSWPGASLGEGRPGWHIECTVIAQKYLPAPFTVQGGGSDLIFPHHEMGAGHAYSLAGVPLARHFAHTGMVGLDGEKMSKSKGNLVLVSRLRTAGEEPAAIRLAIMAHHYRSEWSWTDEAFLQAKARLKRWREAAACAPAGSAGPLIEQMRSALANDLDAPAALAAVDRWADNAASDSSNMAALADGSLAGAPASRTDEALVNDALSALLGVEL